MTIHLFCMAKNYIWECVSLHVRGPRFILIALPKNINDVPSIQLFACLMLNVSLYYPGILAGSLHKQLWNPLSTSQCAVLRWKIGNEFTVPNSLVFILNFIFFICFHLFIFLVDVLSITCGYVICLYCVDSREL
jgi:hypothetical protein